MKALFSIIAIISIVIVVVLTFNLLWSGEIDMRWWGTLFLVGCIAGVIAKNIPDNKQ